MSTQDTYHLRVLHCPVCGDEATHRAVLHIPYAPCPRCNGAKYHEFRNNPHAQGLEPQRAPETDHLPADRGISG